TLIRWCGAGVVVGAEDAELGVAGRHAALELLEAAPIDRTERLHVHRFLHCRRLSRHRAESNRRVALCRRAPRRSATVSGRASERIRTSAPGVEARCSRPLSYGGVVSPPASSSSPTRTCSVSRCPNRAMSAPTEARVSSRPAREGLTDVRGVGSERNTNTRAG